MRRTRIKGVANIPQRKKTDVPTKGEEGVKNIPEASTTIPEDPKKESEDLKKSLAAGKKIIKEEIIRTSRKVENPSALLKANVHTSIVKKELLEESKPKNLVHEPVKTSPDITPDIVSEANLPVPDSIESEDTHRYKKTEENHINPVIIKSKNAREIKFSNDHITNCERQKCHDIKQLESRQEESEERSFLQPPKSPLNTQMNAGKKLAGPSEIKRITSPHPSIGSDTEYPVPPASPNKINRSRIKAIPRIGYRKISFSASESEDESKKVNCRTRNDSQSSNVSGVQETIIEQQTPSAPKVKEYSSVIQRKCKRTEWSRKLAEARREFTRKFEAGKPDHKKLTMIDLIFYNPTTNPMVKEDRKPLPECDSRTEKNDDQDVINESEKEDDPEDKDEEKSKTSDEENEIPAPQIKIGPAGEIILDEKSLVIENKQTKKNREEMQRSQVIDGNSDRPYGVVKKVKRSKDWSHSETLRFYKALSTIGTDFSLMCELFPNRTRRELKMKFKKEERVNQALVDKAVMEPCGFDFAELKKEFELVEIELKELENQRIKDEKLRKNKEIKKSIKFLNIIQENNPINKKSGAKMPVNELRCDSNGTLEAPAPSKNRKKDKGIVNIVRKRKLDIMSVLSDSDSLESDSDESEVIWRPTQTRYGRRVRKRQIYDPEPSLDEELLIPRKVPKPIEEKQPNQKPGSLMMIHTENSNGEPIVKIFMVTDNATKDNLDPANLLPIAMISGGETKDQEEIPIENNYTIPAEPQDEDRVEIVAESVNS